MTENLIFVGSFGVDSGIAMVGDPCYLDNWDTNKNDKWDIKDKIGEFSYHGACATTLDSMYGELGNGSAVVFNTGFGDGLYPVFVKLNDEGRVSKVIIDFEGELDVDSDVIV